MAETHSLGPTCAYYESQTNLRPQNAFEPPPLRAQFFYVSSLPIDDPLSPLPPIQAAQAANHPPQPFSVRDNAALEEAWQGCQRDNREAKLQASASDPKPIKGVFSFPKFKRGGKHTNADDLKRRTEQDAGPQQTLRATYDKLPRKPDSEMEDKSGSGSSSKKNHDSRIVSDVLTSGRGTGAGSDVDRKSPSASQRTSIRDSVSESQVFLSQSIHMESKGDEELVDSQELGCQDQDQHLPQEEVTKRSRRLSPFRKKQPKKLASNTELHAASINGRRTSDHTPDPMTQQSPSDISGRPFARAPSRRDITKVSANGAANALAISDASDADRSRSRSHERVSRGLRKEKVLKENPKVFVPVGVSRLHLVEMPDLVMKPIYWNPINDTSNVIRATWFYKDTMLPLPVDVANKLEIGYEFMKPYGESYQEELQACIENGVSAEEKIVYKLWPDEQKTSRPSTAADNKAELAEAETPDTSILPENFQNAAIDPQPKDSKSDRRLFKTYSVIYSDNQNAQILRPNLIPSVKHNRAPLSSIKKGRQIGIAVVRGFDQKTWLKLHPDAKLDARAAHAKVGAYLSQSGDATTRGRRNSCAVCEEKSAAPTVSDLVLVIHGIGQKLSERVDSFHFTHAINDLRRQFNVELSSESVKGNLKDANGIMVLPVNWRLTLSFDDDHKLMETRNEESKYQLTDITPDSLPGIRSLISDVMLDIPYYLSHHKEKMTAAVIREANRVYRLWCRNNPGFQDYGKVHLIAHSLGSVMAMEILSRQPTTISHPLNLDSMDPSEVMFEFDTTNLFCCGSPCGFFLLLNGVNLVPRKGRNKTGMEGEDYGQGIAGESTYGCPALDNIYNICHQNDPVSYFLNASVDKDYAQSLQTGVVPSVDVGLFAKVGNTLRWTANAGDPYATTKTQARPQMQNMPSTMELETHNFTREEIAEKRMYLLNDNGQIDYYLNSGGGPLEFQYLNMLSAHSSYWVLRDFVRFLVVEIGRKSGREHTLPALRASKKREFKRGKLD